MTTDQLLKNAVSAEASLAAADTETKNNVLIKASEYLLADQKMILEANALDVKNAEGHISSVMIDRLSLSEERIKAMADGIIDVVGLPDPVGVLLDESQRPNGLKIAKVSVPFGVVAIIYESRPNVTSDAAALSLKSGNVCVLRGGKESINSNIAIANCFRQALKDMQLSEDCVCLVTDTSRESAAALMGARGYVDLLIPRGGAGLIKACVDNAKVPCIETGTGICHIYVSRYADIDKALDIIDNAKTSRPSVCNAAEVCIVDEEIADSFLPMLRSRLTEEKTALGKQAVELILDEKAASVIEGTAASDQDFDTEFLDYKLAVKVVRGINEAISHIAAHSTGHSDAIITEDPDEAKLFTRLVDSAAVYVNASTRFTDGGEFGLGCELGISTQKMHARGPMGLREMTTYKYIITGNGQIR